MKTLILAFSLLLSSACFAQTVTIKTTGNRNTQIAVGDRIYAINNSSNTDINTVVIQDLDPGVHTLKLTRRSSGSRTTSSNSSFTVRNGYDLTLNISANGSISSAETRATSVSNGSRGQINANAFNRLVTQTKAKSSSTSRSTYLKTQFTSLNKTMTSKQAAQLIQLVNSENLRFDLAKQVYPLVSDKQNFSSVSSLLNSTSNRTALENFIASLEDTDDIDDTDENALTDEKFKIIYNEVVAESGNSNKTYYLSNFFAKDFNMYSSQQAGQLIALIADEAGRLSLAKAAFRGTIDKQNYEQVSRLLSSSYSRSELTSYINTFNSTNPMVAMSAADFDKIYQSAYRQNSSSLRYNTINSAFTTSGNYFTATQAARLLPLVNDDASRLSLSKTVYRVLVDKPNYTQFNAYLSTASRNALASYVNDGGYNNSTNVMSDADFNKLLQDANSSWSTTSRYNILGDAFKSTTNYFTATQARQLLNLINSENDRLALAKLSVDNIADRENYSLLYDLFGTTNRNDLTNYVNTYINGGVAAKVAMSDTEFNTLYRNLQFTFGIGAKYSAVTELFADQTKYFTVAQAKQLIQMLSSESNRLELSKGAYDNITDLSNFSQLYDVLPSQGAKNELKTFVENNTANK